MRATKRISAFLLLPLLFSWMVGTLPALWFGTTFPPKITSVQATTQTFTTNGSWQAPSGVTSVTVEVWGAGGAGGKGGGSNKNGGGGGAGGQFVSKVVTVTPGNTYGYTVGTGGTITAGDGNPGGDSTFDTAVVVAKGGAGGKSYANGSGQGVGSTTGGVGDTVYAGGSGAAGGAALSGGGGGGAGSTGTGSSASGVTAGSATSQNGGAGGAGTTVNSAAGGAGNTYGGAGGGATKTNTPGNGANGFIRLTFNSPPTFSVIPSDSPDPVTLGNNVTFSATATDTESNTWYLAVCKTNAVTAGSPPTCAANQTYCVSSSAVASGAQNSCTWTSDGSTGARNWYAFACDTASNAICSPVNSTNSPVTVNAPISVSLTLTSDGTVNFGTLISGGSVNTVALTDTQIIQNDGNVAEDFNIKTSAPAGWTLGATTATDTFVHEFSTSGGSSWTPFTTADSYQTLASNILAANSQNFDLRFTAPSPSTSATQKSITITIQAVQH